MAPIQAGAPQKKAKNKIEVFERVRDPDSGEYLDERGSARPEDTLAQARKSNFIGIAANQDELTLILMSKRDQVFDKMTRQIIFGANGKPVLNPD